MTPPFEPLISIRACARLASCPQRTFLRRLKKLSLADRAEEVSLARARGELCGWLVFLGGRDWRVNLSWLRQRHPALFSRRYVKPEEIEEHTERMADLERATLEFRQETKRSLGGHGARLRALEGMLRELLARVGKLEAA